MPPGKKFASPIHPLFVRERGSSPTGPCSGLVSLWKVLARICTHSKALCTPPWYDRAPYPGAMRRTVWCGLVRSTSGRAADRTWLA